MRSTQLRRAALAACATAALACSRPESGGQAAASGAAVDSAPVATSSPAAADTAAAGTAAPDTAAPSVATAAATPASRAAGAKPALTVYKSPSCGCCKNWVTYMQSKGYAVSVRDLSDADLDEMKASQRVPGSAQSCHTALVDGYVIEGHVPAEDVERLLREKPKVSGLAVPGMVSGSPGMEMPGAPAEHYDVVAFDRTGKTSVFAKH